MKWIHGFWIIWKNRCAPEVAAKLVRSWLRKHTTEHASGEAAQALACSSCSWSRRSRSGCCARHVATKMVEDEAEDCVTCKFYKGICRHFFVPILAVTIFDTPLSIFLRVLSIIFHKTSVPKVTSGTTLPGQSDWYPIWLSFALASG